MSKRLIWLEGDDFTGWSCSHCPWGITAPRCDNTVAALAFQSCCAKGLREPQLSD